MPNIKSAEKRARQAAVRTERNRRVKSVVLRSAGSRKRCKAATAIRREKLKAAIRQIDKAAARGVSRTTPPGENRA